MKLYIAEIKDSNSKWNEEFNIPETAIPADYVNGFIDEWNNRNDKKYKRELVSVVDAGELEYTFERIVKDAGKFYDYCRRQESNAYGNRGVKSEYRKICSSYNKFVGGSYGDFIVYVNRYKGYDHDNLSRLLELTKEHYKDARKKYLKS